MERFSCFLLYALLFKMAVLLNLLFPLFFLLSIATVASSFVMLITSFINGEKKLRILALKMAVLPAIYILFASVYLYVLK